MQAVQCACPFMLSIIHYVCDVVVCQASFLCTFLNLVKYGKIRKPEFLDFGPEFLDFGPEFFLVDLSFS